MSNFSKRHYEILADVIRQTNYQFSACPAYPDAAQAMKRQIIDCLISRLSSTFELDNPNFSSGRFEDMCRRPLR